MRKNSDKLEKAIKALKNEPTAAGPPQEVIDNILQKLTSAEKPLIDTEKSTISFTKWLKTAKNLAKIAAAAVLLIFAGYAAGRLSAPLDTEQLRALETSLKRSLEPAIRQDVVDELNRQWQLALASTYIQLKDELTQQYRRDLSNFAIQTLAASSAVTNQRLEELIDSINTAQAQHRRWVTSAFEQIESNRLQDRTQLAAGLETLALLTEDELQRTRQEMAQFLTYSQPDSIDVDKSDNLNNLN